MGLLHLRVLTTLSLCMCELCARPKKVLFSCVWWHWGKGSVTSSCVDSCICVYVPLMSICWSLCVCECASLYGNQIIVCICVLALRMMGSEGGCWLCVCVCVLSFPCDCLSPAKQVVVSAFFICMWRPLSLCCCGHPVIVGRDCNHVAVYNHYTTIEEDNVPHIWSFPPLT